MLKKTFSVIKLSAILALFAQSVAASQLDSKKVEIDGKVYEVLWHQGKDEQVQNGAENPKEPNEAE